MFDLPVKSKREQREANRFRNQLLDLGFVRSQLSVYVQYLPLSVRSKAVVAEVKKLLPSGGDVHILAVTDEQWSKAIRFSNSKQVELPKIGDQLVIF